VDCANNNTPKFDMQNIYITFKALGMDIKIPVIKVDESTYNFPIPRLIPEDFFLSPGNYTVNVTKQEFIEDVNFQIPKSLDGQLEDVAFESLYQIMVKHINAFGRILPVDLDTYIGQNILLFNSILQALGKPILSKEEQEERFSKFNYMAFDILPDNLKAIYRTPF
jgi:hypothetical protein